MSPHKRDKIPVSIWCPLIPLDEYERLKPYERHLGRISRAYEDWLASVRGKPFVGTDMGVILDRIRMLMINIGVACADDRQLAEEFQSILSSRLRRTALKHVEKIPEDRELIKHALRRFFEDLRFTRDIAPREEMERAAKVELDTSERGSPIAGVFDRVLKVFQSQNKDEPEMSLDELVRRSLAEGSSVMKKIYVRLLSPDPWGNNLHS